MRARRLALAGGCGAAVLGAAAAACGAGTVAADVRLNWTPKTDAAYPKAVPAGFGTLVCATHSKGYTMWAAGEPASAAMQALAETGDAELLLEELGEAEDVLDFVGLKREAEADGAVAEGPPLAAVSELEFSLKVDGGVRATLVSCAAGIVPSPDFFVGVSGMDMCGGAGEWSASATTRQKLRAWDANTDDGEDYDSADRPVVDGDDRKAIVALLGFTDQYGTYTLGVGGAAGSPASVGAEEEAAGGRSACFPAGERVRVDGGKEVAVEELRAGVHVAAKAGGGEPSPVVFVSHREERVQAAFVRLTVSGGGALRISPEHYLHIADGGLVAAGEVRVGDAVGGGDGGALRVEGVERVVAGGLYAPHAASGELVVSGVRVSCYTRAVRPALAHAVVRVLAAAPSGVVGAAQRAFDGGNGVAFAVAAWLRPLIQGGVRYGPGALG